VVALLALAFAAPVAAQNGTIVGQVVDRSSNQPLAGAQVYVVGTTRGGLANQDGRFIIQQVPAGQHEVRATLIGYSQQTRAVELVAGATATVSFELSETAIELGAVVVSATGQQQTKREIGSSVGVISTEEVDLAPVTSFSDLIQGRTAGAVVLQSSGQTGAGSKIRIRGSNSISLDNSPLLVVDGVRVDNDPNITPIGGLDQAPSALDDLNPENIESIEILKGPAASALYGTAAANGVIQVTTKKGRAGEPQVHAWTEAAALNVSVEFPDNVQGFDAAGNLCPLIDQATISETTGEPLCGPVTEMHRFNPLENESTTVFDGGSKVVYGASVAGGGENSTFFLSAERSDEESVYDSENWLERWNLQANMTGALSETLRVRGSVGFVETDAQFPQGDNSLFGAVGMGLYGPAHPASVEATQGYTYPLDFHYDWKTFQKASRFMSSAGADWAPMDWLSFNASAGLERITREDRGRVPRVSAYQVYGGVYENGWIQVSDWDIYNINTNFSGTAVYDLTPSLVSTSTVGTQYIREETNEIYSFGAGLTPGIEESLAGATSDFSTAEGNVLNATIGAYAQQQFAWMDRVFVNAALRGDQNTAFGTDIGWIWYPSISSSWVISEESFFPENDLLTELRLRGAYGQAGLRPGATDALLSFGGDITTVGQADVAAITINELGNPDLKPERTEEYELGFEGSLLNGRFGLETTYYYKKSTDALVNKPLPPSPGGSVNRFENLGAVKNSGLELALYGEALRNDAFTWNFGVTGSFLDNELLDLGEDAQGNPIPPIEFAVDRQRHIEGYPLGGYWQEPILGWDDVNGDGILAPSEVEVADTAEFLGSSFPTREFSFNTDMTFWNLFRVSALFDYKGGHKLFNQTRDLRCRSYVNCEAAFEGSLEEQATIIARSEYGSWAGYIEDADFVKFRELAVTFMLPETWTQSFKASDLRLTLAGRNLATWTEYSGLDPEVNSYGQANFLVRDISALPPNRVFTLRVDANF
jgi:TonB-linked SusC/RagA family outer membrane protein